MFEPKWMFPKIGVPQNGWFIMETPIKMDNLGVPLFLETPKWGDLHLIFQKILIILQNPQNPGHPRMRPWRCRMKRSASFWNQAFYVNYTVLFSWNQMGRCTLFMYCPFCWQKSGIEVKAFVSDLPFYWKCTLHMSLSFFGQIVTKEAFYQGFSDNIIQFRWSSQSLI